MIKETERRFSPLTDNPGTERKAHKTKPPSEKEGFMSFTVLLPLLAATKPPSEEEGFMSVRQTPKITFLPERQLPWPAAAVSASFDGQSLWAFC